MTSSLFEINRSRLSIDENDPFKELTKVQLLGAGGFGTVNLYRSNTDQSFECAVKKVKIQPREPTHSSVVRSINREESVIMQLKELENHDNIVETLFYKKTEYVFLVFMEYMPGGDLNDFIIKNGSQKNEIILQYLKQIANGIKFLHSHKITHFDIKSNNILLDRKNDPKVLKICYYGLSKHLPGEKSTKYEYEVFVAPEVYDAHDNEHKDHSEFSPKTDIWPLGVIGLHLATGQLNSDDPGKIPDELKIFKTSCQKDNPVPSVLESLLVINPQNRCDVDSALDLIENASLLNVAVNIIRLPDDKQTAQLKSELINHFRYHHTDDNAIEVAVEIIKPFYKYDNWFVISCNNSDDITDNCHINVKVDDRQHLFYYNNNHPEWKDVTEESVKPYLNSIKWTTKSAVDISNTLDNHFGGYWFCVISSNNDTKVYGKDLIVRLNNGKKFITLY